MHFLHGQNEAGWFGCVQPVVYEMAGWMEADAGALARGAAVSGRFGPELQPHFGISICNAKVMSRDEIRGDRCIAHR